MESKETHAHSSYVNWILIRTFPLQITLEKHKSSKGHFCSFSVLCCWVLWEMLSLNIKAGSVWGLRMELPWRGTGSAAWQTEVAPFQEHLCSGRLRFCPTKCIAQTATHKVLLQQTVRKQVHATVSAERKVLCPGVVSGQHLLEMLKQGQKFMFPTTASAF